MPEFDKSQFEQLMSAGVRAHGQGQHEVALDIRQQAFALAPDPSIEKGRAARDIGASYDRLGRRDAAREWADRAFGVHNDLVQEMDEPTREALRQRAVSAMYVGVYGVRAAMDALSSSRPVGEDSGLLAMRQTAQDLKAAKRQAHGLNRLVDQYDVNAGRRISVAETLFGKRARGLGYGLRELVASPLAESRLLDTSDPNMTRQERFRAKTKAFLGGAAAVGVGVVYSHRRGRRQRLGLRIVDKIL